MKIYNYDYLPKEAMDVRIKVFVEEQGFVDKMDDIDSVAIHFVAFEKEMAIGTCRIFLKENSYILGRLAVLSEYRQKGVGRALMTAAEQKVKKIGFNSLMLHSQIRATEFYEKCGYKAFGEVELEENYPHIWMKKEI